MFGCVGLTMDGQSSTMAEEQLNSSLQEERNEALSCDLTGLPSFILQFTLGCIAFSTLILKRYREKPNSRRPVFIWIADSMKQAIGMLGVHFVNLFLSQLLPLPDIDHCILYLLNFLLDSTLGLLIIYLSFKVIGIVVEKCKVTALRTGEYGSPFKVHYWLAQCSIVILVMLVMKLIIGPLVVFKFWKTVGTIILPIQNKELRTAIVIFIVPIVVNVLMFWMVDSIIKSKNDVRHKKKESPPRRKHRHKQHVYLPLADLERSASDPTGTEEHCMTTSDSELLVESHANTASSTERTV